MKKINHNLSFVHLVSKQRKKYPKSMSVCAFVFSWFFDSKLYDTARPEPAKMNEKIDFIKYTKMVNEEMNYVIEDVVGSSVTAGRNYKVP